MDELRVLRNPRIRGAWEMIEVSIPKLRRLRAFEAAARHRSITAAAGMVGLSQPALTQAISALEHEVGSRLLERKATGSFLTECGAIYLGRVERLLHEIDRAISEIGQSRNHAASSAPGILSRKATRTQMRAMLAVAGSGSFSAAARDLAISEPSLHRSAREFERLIRRPLFGRTAHGLSVNRRGAELARRLAVAFREFEYALDEVRASEGIYSGRISVGALGLARTLLMPHLVDSFLDAYPNVSVEIVDGEYNTLLSRLRHGRLDLLVCALRDPAPANDVHQEPLFWDPFAIVVRRDHPLTRRAAVTLEDLVKYKWIVPAHGTPVRDACDAIFEEGRLYPRSTIEAHSYGIVRAMLMEGDRVALSSHRQIALEEKMGLLVVIPYALPQPGRTIGVAIRRGWAPAAIQKKFMNSLRECGRALDTERVLLPLQPAPQSLPCREPSH
jgi:LysR family transcriptional regulator, regulator for genes of the gallate degradation pathway